MNWTGGALSRSRNANAKESLSVRQKNHFAKARVKLQKGRHSPPEIQYFDFGEWKPQCGVHDDQRSKPGKRTERASSQRTLDQFENVEGVVRKLKSLRPRTDTRKWGRSPINDSHEARKRKRSPINDTEGDVLPSGVAIPPISPIIISSRSPVTSSPNHAEPTATPTSKRLPISPSSTSDDPDLLAVLDTVEAKRRKLLEENDWVGVERQKRMSKPVNMTFTDAEDRDLIGRRRPLNSSTVQNRWNMQGSRRTKIPMTASYSEKPRGPHGGLGDDKWSADGISIHIGSTATNKGPISDEMLDGYQSPVKPQHSSQSRSVQNFDYDHVGSTPKPQHRRREVTTPLASKDESSEPFHSLFSPEEVEQSGKAQLVEAATIVDNDNLSPPENELRLPEDYRFPEPEPGFRLVFEQTPQPRGQTSVLNNSSSPIVRDFALMKGQPTGAAIERVAHPECRKVLDGQVSGYAPVEEEQSNTSPLSIATSRYMQELENQTFGSGSQGLFDANLANKIATARVVDRNKAEQKRETTGDREREISEQPDEARDKEVIQPTEYDDDDEIWRSFVNPDGIHEFQPNQEQPTTTQIPHATPRAPDHDVQALDQVFTKSTAPKTPPSSSQDDEMVWWNFIFSDLGPNDEWDIEEASPNSPPGNHILKYGPARTQPSMIAEAATSPVKQNPHLLDEMLDDSTLILDDASRYANVSTSSTGSPGMAEKASSVPQQLLHPSDSPLGSSVSATASPTIHDTQTLSSNLPPPQPNPRIPKPYSLIAEPASSLPARQPQNPSPTGATNNDPSSDELGWTPSRLPATTKEKVVFSKPSRYVSDPPGTVHLGRKISKGRKKMGLAEAVERAKGKVGGRGKGRRKSGNTEAEIDTDDIVDD